MKVMDNENKPFEAQQEKVKIENFSDLSRKHVKKSQL